jgi:hypothetical protein
MCVNFFVNIKVCVCVYIYIYYIVLKNLNILQIYLYNINIYIELSLNKFGIRYLYSNHYTCNKKNSTFQNRSNQYISCSY